jgi:Peptidase family M48
VRNGIKLTKKILTIFLFALVGPFTAVAQTNVFQVFNSQGVQIGPGKYLYVNFHVDTYLRRARLAGNVMARGGGGNDIIVRVIKDGRAVFDSGQQRSIVLSIPLNEPGQYSLIITNEFSIISSKVVWGYVNLYSDGEDTPRASSEARKQQSRQILAQRILHELYGALEADEKQWYTRQVPVEPRIIVTSDDDLNAFAVPSQNSIYVFKAVFDVAETMASQSSQTRSNSMLAGVIGHELAHIFYHHWTDRKSGLWGELSGSLPIDRNQERQADVLGTRLACQAGYEPGGLLDFMRLLIARKGNGSDFGSNHPNSRQRAMMIQQVARQCPAQ